MSAPNILGVKYGHLAGWEESFLLTLLTGFEKENLIEIKESYNIYHSDKEASEELFIDMLNQEVILKSKDKRRLIAIACT